MRSRVLIGIFVALQVGGCIQVATAQGTATRPTTRPVLETPGEAVPIPSGPRRTEGYPPDDCVLGMFDGENAVDYYLRTARILDALPPTVATVEFWAHHYTNGSRPVLVEGKPTYIWRCPQMIRILKVRGRTRGLKCLFYYNPGYFARHMTPDEQLTFLAAHYRSCGGWDGIYLDGVPPTGIATDKSVAFLWTLRDNLRRISGHEPFFVMHASGYVAPGEWARPVDHVHFGEHGEGTVPWSDFQVGWSRGEWMRLDRLSHPQYNTFTRKLLAMDVWPSSKMPTAHEMGTACRTVDEQVICYPEDWPVEHDWKLYQALFGPIRVWCWTGVSPLFAEAAALRARYEEN